MDQVQSAALTLAGVTLGFLLLAFLVSRWLRDRGAPRPSESPRKDKPTKPPRRNRAMEAPVEIAPARLARISGRASLDPPVAAAPDLLVTERPAPASPPPDDEAISQRLESLAAAAEQQAAPVARHGDEPVTVRLVPQIPPRDTVHPASWLGGRPRLDRGTPWPEIREIPVVFLAQISFADLPRELWDGLGPRSGAYAVFTHPHDGDMRVIPVAEPGDPGEPPRPQDDAEHWFTPRGALHFGDLKPFIQRGVPMWPIDPVAVRPGDADPHDANIGGGDGPIHRLDRTGYDIADRAFHPFDWELMVALAEILAMRIERFWRDVDGVSPIAAQAADVERRLATLYAGGDDVSDRDELDNMRHALGELVAATEAAAATNRDARIRAEEIVAIIRDSAHKTRFSASDAAAVMDALRAIRWTKVHRRPDPEGRTGAERIESLSLALTEHHPDAPLWVHDYHSVWFDRARHAYAADPGALPADTRALLDNWCGELAARETGGAGPVPLGTRHDAEAHAILIDLPSSELMGWTFGDAGRLTLMLRKADLAVGRFDRPIVQVGHHH